LPLVDFDTKGIEPRRISTVYRCIVCGKVVSFDYDYYSDYHRGSSWKSMDVEPYVVLDVEGITWWRDRVVCKKCFRTRKKELRDILYEKAVPILKSRLEHTRQQIKRLRSELRKALRQREHLKRLLRSKANLRWKVEKKVDVVSQHKR